MSWESWKILLIFVGIPVFFVIMNDKGKQYTLYPIYQSDTECVAFSKEMANVHYNKALRNPELWNPYYKSPEDYAKSSLARGIIICH
jgi:hypothetical protein